MNIIAQADMIKEAVQNAAEEAVKNSPGNSPTNAPANAPSAEDLLSLDAEQLVDKLQAWGTTFGMRLVAAIAILVFGYFVARLVRRGVEKLMHGADTDPTVVDFVGRLIYVGLMAFVIVASISKLGVQTASLVALIGAIGLAVGMALQGSLSNFAAGVLLILMRPIQVGDYVEVNDEDGTVKSISLLYTRVVTRDNRLVFVPNGLLMDDNIVNCSALGKRRIDLVVGIDYDADIQKAREVIMQVLEGQDMVLEDPEPVVKVLELADSSVVLGVRPWVDSDNYMPVRLGLYEKIKDALDDAGINIPFPQRDVHLFEETEPEEGEPEDTGQPSGNDEQIGEEHSTSKDQEQSGGAGGSGGGGGE